MDVPAIETLIHRSFGTQAEARAFGHIQWAAGADLATAMAVFDAGGNNVEHTHPNCEELVYVLEGEIEHTLGDQSTMLGPGDTIIVPRHAPHRLINRTGAPCRMLIVFSDAEREFVPTGK